MKKFTKWGLQPLYHKAFPWKNLCASDKSMGFLSLDIKYINDKCYRICLTRRTISNHLSKKMENKSFFWIGKYMSPQPWNSHVEILTLGVIVTGSRPLEVIRAPGCGPHEWDKCPNKRDDRELPYPFYQVKTQWENGNLWTRRRDLARDCIFSPQLLYFPASRTVRNKCFLFKLLSAYSFFFVCLL